VEKCSNGVKNSWRVVMPEKEEEEFLYYYLVFYVLTL